MHHDHSPAGLGTILPALLSPGSQQQLEEVDRCWASCTGQISAPASSCMHPYEALSALLPQVSQQRLEEVRKELADLQDKLQPLMLRYQQEKQRLEEIRQLQKKKEELLIKLQEAENRMDLAMVADIKWVLYLLLSAMSPGQVNAGRACGWVESGDAHW